MKKLGNTGRALTGEVLGPDDPVPETVRVPRITQWSNRPYSLEIEFVFSCGFRVSVTEETLGGFGKCDVAGIARIFSAVPEAFNILPRHPLGRG